MEFYLLTELSIFALFIFILYHAYKIRRLDFLLYSTIFATLFENLHVMILSGVGGYIYNPVFTVFVFRTPLFVILSWGILLFSSVNLVEKITSDKLSKIFLVPIFTVIIDFLMEPVAVHLHFWTWIGFESGLKIAPANFIGWIGVSFGFILFYEYLSAKWLSSFLSYAGFLVVGASGFILNSVFALNDSGTYILVALYSFVFLALGIYFARTDIAKIFGGHKKRKNDISKFFRENIFILFPRGLFYSFSIVMLIYLGLILSFDVLVVVISVVLLETIFWVIGSLRFGSESS